MTNTNPHAQKLLKRIRFNLAYKIAQFCRSYYQDSTDSNILEFADCVEFSMSVFTSFAFRLFFIGNGLGLRNILFNTNSFKDSV